jgi:uncharacterized protein (DUF305 family)
MKRATTLVAATVLSLGLLAGCGEESSSGSTEGSSQGVPASADHNGADVAFARAMIPHHAQALSMVDLTMGRPGLSPEFVALTEEIRAAQAPEIEEMSDWLESWGEDVPETMRDHVNAGHGDEDGTDGHSHGDAGTDPEMEGMLSTEELEALEHAPAAEFEDRWLEAMIAHHEGAIGMARDEVEDGEHPDAVRLAESVVESQRAEIDRMRGMIGG